MYEITGAHYLSFGDHPPQRAGNARFTIDSNDKIRCLMNIQAEGIRDQKHFDLVRLF